MAARSQYYLQASYCGGYPCHIIELSRPAIAIGSPRPSIAEEDFAGAGESRTQLLYRITSLVALDYDYVDYVQMYNNQVSEASAALPV